MSLQSRSLNNGFYISIDFELFWGFSKEFEISDKERFKFEQTRLVLPEILQLFKDYEIAATWAIVGTLLNQNKNELLRNIIPNQPSYPDINSRNYHKMELVGEDEHSAPWHYAYSLCKHIKETAKQEIATHTYSHFYCLEKGQDRDMFEEDIYQAKNITVKKLNVQPQSIVFPRNQVNYKDVLTKLGLKTYRGTCPHWAYRQSMGSDFYSLSKRVFRFLDRYLPLINDVFNINKINKDNDLIDVQESRLLVGCNQYFKKIEPLRLNRIKKSMLKAAKENLSYHLWWHPHNFSMNQEENLIFLKEILEYYQVLKKKYDFTSYSMINSINYE